MKTELSLFDQKLNLFRYPVRKNETLQAWDAGDEYLIQYVSEHYSAQPLKHILIINDHFGALTCWWAQQSKVTHVSDSYLAQQGAKANLRRNHIDDQAVDFITTLDTLPDHVDLVLLVMPKINRHLVWILQQLATQLPSHTPLIGVNKVKEIHTSTLNLIEKHFGQPTTSLAQKKHRLIFAHNEKTSTSIEALTCWPVSEYGITLANYANVYSGEKLDQGARFMLEHLPETQKPLSIVDLGCGNGVLSVRVAQLCPNAHLTLVDESHMAVASAKHNLTTNLPDDVREHRFLVNNCLEGYQGPLVDLILCNPPFHQQQAVTDHIAWQMFVDSHKALKPGGQLQVIGNRHLGYQQKLTRLFGQQNVNIVASNKKFVIFLATK